MMIDKIYTHKKPCPRDLGIFICNECKRKYLEDASNVDYPIDAPSGCGKIIDNNHRCGFTHLGYEWCDECVTKNRAECGHVGQLEVVAVAYEPPQIEYYE